jgi:Smg protein
MKQTVIDILIYLFENYMDDDLDIAFDQNEIKLQLKDAGFEVAQVTRALDWLEDLSTAAEDSEGVNASCSTSTRIFTTSEELKLDIECRGFIYFLEQVGVLDPENRELVIDRVMALDNEDVDLEQLKWIVLMVMFNKPGHEHSLAWMEDIVMDDVYSFVH